MNKFNKLAINIFIRNNSNKYFITNLNYSKKSPINVHYENKNPRNLEWSGHQFKRFGWNLQYPPKDFYHQCSFKRQKNHLEGIVEHSSGEIVVKASTNEIALLQYLTSSKDTNAAINLARLLADRCHKYGLTNMMFHKSATYDESTREKVFYETLIQNGIIFEEPEFKQQAENSFGLDYDDKDFYTGRTEQPFQPLLNRLKKI